MSRVAFALPSWLENLRIKKTMECYRYVLKLPSTSTVDFDNYLERSIKEWLDGNSMYESLLDVEQIANYFPHVLYSVDFFPAFVEMCFLSASSLSSSRANLCACWLKNGKKRLFSLKFFGTEAEGREIVPSFCSCFRFARRITENFVNVHGGAGNGLLLLKISIIYYLWMFAGGMLWRGDREWRPGVITKVNCFGHSRHLPEKLSEKIFVVL